MIAEFWAKLLPGFKKHFMIELLRFRREFMKTTLVLVIILASSILICSCGMSGVESTSNNSNQYYDTVDEAAQNYFEKEGYGDNLEYKTVEVFPDIYFLCNDALTHGLYYENKGYQFSLPLGFRIRSQAPNEQLSAIIDGFTVIKSGDTYYVDIAAKTENYIDHELISDLQSRNEPIENEDGASEYLVEENGNTEFGYGRYKEPDGFVFVPEFAELEGFTSGQKRYYVLEDEDIHQEGVVVPTVSVETGENRYGMDEHERFKDGIVASLNGQLQSSGIKATVSGSGSSTQEDYPLYTFIITMESDEMRQYYVVGEEKYLLVVAAYSEGDPEEEITDAALEIANSFVWD